MRIGLSPLLSHPPHCLSCRSFSTIRHQTGLNLDQIRQELLSRPLNVLEDHLTPTNSQLLNSSLSDFLPLSCQTTTLTGDNLPGGGNYYTFPQGHHLVYFPTRATSNQLLPDGTDTFHSPGAPFVRRMWAGGSLHFNTYPKAMPRTGPHDPNRAVCLEGIRDVRIKGPLDEEKIFVDIERQYILKAKQKLAKGNIRSEKSQFLEMTTDRIKPFFLLEKRTLVFMRARTDGKGADQSDSHRFVKPPLEAEFSMELTPTPSLLFRFSALTFNAHLIHLSREYASEIEGHRNMLVHGPLTLVLILSLLSSQLKKDEVISSFHYKNLAPLYVNEMMKVCGRRKSDGSFVMWIEDSRGSLAVKGDAAIATMNSVTSSEADVQSKSENKDISTVPPNIRENQPQVGEKRDLKITKYMSNKAIVTKYETSKGEHNLQKTTALNIHYGLKKRLAIRRKIESRKSIISKCRKATRIRKVVLMTKQRKELPKRTPRVRRYRPAIRIRKVLTEPIEVPVKIYAKRDRAKTSKNTLFRKIHKSSKTQLLFKKFYVSSGPPFLESYWKEKEAKELPNWRDKFIASPEWKDTNWKDQFRSILNDARKTRRNPFRARQIVARKSGQTIEKKREEDLKLVDEVFGMIGSLKKP